MTKKERLEKAKKDHADFLASVGYRPGCVDHDALGYLEKSYLAIPTKPAKLSNSVGNGFKHSVDDYKWKHSIQETPETIREIEKKKNRLAPVANKAGYQYITPNADIETLGKKV
jgi:hypothetical protein